MASAEKLIGLVSKSLGIETLKALKYGEKSFMGIVKTIKADKSTIYRRLREFVEHGFVSERYDYEERCLKYSLTDKGRTLLEAVEQFEKTVEDLELATS